MRKKSGPTPRGAATGASNSAASSRRAKKPTQPTGKKPVRKVPIPKFNRGKRSR